MVYPPALDHRCSQGGVLAPSNLQGCVPWCGLQLSQSVFVPRPSLTRLQRLFQHHTLLHDGVEKFVLGANDMAWRPPSPWTEAQTNERSNAVARQTPLACDYPTKNPCCDVLGRWLCQPPGRNVRSGRRVTLERLNFFSRGLRGGSFFSLSTTFKCPVQCQ